MAFDIANSVIDLLLNNFKTVIEEEWALKNHTFRVE